MMMCEGSGVAGDRNEKPGRLQVFGDARGQAGGGGWGGRSKGGALTAGERGIKTAMRRRGGAVGR